METKCLETRRLILKPIEIDHASSYEKNFVDYEVIRHLSASVPWPYPEDGIRNFIKDYIIPNQGKDRWSWGMFLKSSPNEMIGGVELWRKGCPENRGFWLGKEYWGNSYMTEANEVILDYAFLYLNFEKLVFSNAKGNIGSRKIKEKTGAVLKEVVPSRFVDERYTESEVWALKKDNWFKFRVEKILKTSPIFIELFRNCDYINLKNWYIAGGAVTQTIWNYLSGNDLTHGINDIDLIFFDLDLSDEEEKQRINAIQKQYKNLSYKIDIKNQANVYKWYPQKYGYEIEPYTSTEDGMGTWLSSFSIGIRLETNEFIVNSLQGFDDIFTKTIRPNKRQITQDIYKVMTKRLKRDWPEITVIDY